ncbi:hypothetical protein [Vulgatibacter sp.]|uniref:hypothetical protein n=1 Tax=Vulgatibacter sp. TaxID=1971226 RepID=UPI003561CEE4
MMRFLVAPFVFYVVALALGLALRFFFVAPFAGIDFGNAVHAHSHTLYFGWVGLGIFALAFRRVGASDRLAGGILHAIAVVSAATFVAFLHSGYALPGIVVSTIALLVWAAAVVVFWRRARGQQGIDLAFLRAGMFYVLLATAGAWARVVILALGISDPLPGKLAVFAFLHDFAWFFVLSIFGLLAWLGPRIDIRLDERLLRLQLRLTIPFAWLTFPLGVPGGGEGVLGLVAKIAALALLVPAAIGCFNLWRASPRTRWLAFWFGLQAAMEGAGALGLAEAALQSRHLAILYLHVLLVGFVSLGLAMLLLAARGRVAALATSLHNLGLATMGAGLALAGGGIVGLGALALPGLWLATAGGAGIALAGVAFLAAALRPEPLPLPATA